MTNGQPTSPVEEITGVAQQLSPHQEQLSDGMTELRSLPPSPLVEIAEPERRIPPTPVGAAPAEAAAAGAAPGAPAPTPVVVAFPVVRLNRYVGTDKSFQMLIDWMIPAGYVGDLHEIAISSDNDAKTRYRITIAGVDMQLPLDRQTSTPLTIPWNDNKFPGPATVSIEVQSTDGTSITVDGQITGVLRSP